MPALLTRLDPAPHPSDTTWADPSPGPVPAGVPTAVVATRPLGSGPAVLVHVHDTLPAVGTSGAVVPCPRAVYLAGTAAGPARFASVVEFDGPRSREWVAAEWRASHDRLEPATRDVPGYVGTLHLTQEDGGVVVMSLAETAEALQLGLERAMSTELLPGEDPALLTGPDRVTFSVVVRAELPAPVPG